MQHRLFRSCLGEANAEYSDLLMHNDVRWLSKRRMLGRFWSIRNEVLDFLRSQKAKKACDFVQFVEDLDKMTVVAFLAESPDI